jgi:AcrR family transcriptional regulator
MTVLTSPDTRERLLMAGMQVFATSGGYELGTIREITLRAGANQAAVNYHFGNKAALYEAVVYRAFEKALVPLESLAPQIRERAALVHALVTDMVSGSLRGDIPAMHLRIIAAEMFRPTGVLQAVAAETLDLRTPRLASRLRALSDRSEDEGASLLLAHWLLGSCVIALQLAPKSAYGETPEALEAQRKLVDELTHLLLNGLNGPRTN